MPIDVVSFIYFYTHFVFGNIFDFWFN